MRIKKRNEQENPAREAPQSQELEIGETQLTEEVLRSLARSGCHPIVQLARYALGDVVGLGLMTQEEYDEERIYDLDGILLQESGLERALTILPTKIRYEANKELAGYIWAKARPRDVGPANEDDKAVVPQYYLPDNGRYNGPVETEENPDAIDAEVIE